MPLSERDYMRRPSGLLVPPEADESEPTEPLAPPYQHPFEPPPRPTRWTVFINRVVFTAVLVTFVTCLTYPAFLGAVLAVWFMLWVVYYVLRLAFGPLFED